MRRTKTFILVLLGLQAGAGFGIAASAGNGPSTSAMISSARVPFVANEGQIADPDVKYYARTFGGTVYALSDGKIVYSLPKYESGKTAGSAVITESLRGAFRPEPSGAGKSPVAVSSFIGNRPEKWKSNLPVFDRLDFGEVYEGVSLLLSARGNNVEKIFVLSPGADPRDIAFGFEGVLGLEIMPDGKLELQTALGEVYFTRPVAWQIGDAGVIPQLHDECFVGAPLAESDLKTGTRLARPLQHTLTPVEVSYVLDEDGIVRFELSSYDPNKILVIDPLLASTFIGGGGADAVQSMAVDSQTNIYVAGYTDSIDFPTNNGAYNSRRGGQDAFVSKFDANLGALAASTYLGGSSDDQATAIHIASDARIWLAGYTESDNFPGTATGYQPNYGGVRDAFVAIMTSNLNSLVQATYLGGSNADYAAAIAINNLSSNQYVVGYTESTNFPVTASGYNTNYNGRRDAFVVLFSNTVGSLKGGTFLGGTNADEAAGVVVTPGTDSTNFVFVVGSTASTNFPFTNAYQRIYGGGSNDAFVSRLSALLTNLSASTFLGGTGSDMAYAVGLDISNRLYVAGSTTSTNFPRNITNQYLVGYTNSWRGGQDIFVSCLTNNLTGLYASTYIGGTGDDAAKCLVVDSSSATNLIYLAGYTTSTNFPTTPNAYDRSHNGGEDAFTLRLDGALTNLYASTYLGGVSNDQALALALGPESNTLFVAGITASSNFPSSDAAYQNVFGGGTNDGFVTKFPASLAYGTLKWKKFIGWYCSSPAMTWDGTVTLGNSTSLFAFTRSGAERWQVGTTSAVASQSPTDYAGLGVPAVGTNNVIYVNTYSGIVFSIASTGAVNWTFRSGALAEFWSSVAFGNENKIFFSKASTFYALNQDGIGLWTNSMANETWSSPAIGSNEIIYTANYNGPNLYAFDSAGSTNHVWNMSGIGNYMYSSPALDTNGIIYAMASNILYAFSPDYLTTQRWTAADGGSYSWSSPAIGSNGDVYVGGGSNLYSFNTNGGTGYVWRTDSEVKSSPAISADGSIIVGSTNGVYSFNPNGTTNWFFHTDDTIHFQSPLIDSEGTIYVSDDGLIYAIYGPEPPADSAWPMFRHDSLRTGNQGMNVADFLRPARPTVSKYGAFTNIHVSWSASSNALNYELWRNTNDSTAGATQLRRLTQTNYNDSSIEAGKIYFYWVKVKTPIALSAFSASDSGGVPPSPPEGVTASKGDPTNYVLVTWQASTNATNYYIYRDDTNAARIGTSFTTNYNDTNVASGQRYYYWIKAANDVAGESGFSSNDYGGIPCWPPSGFSASSTYTQRVNLSWNYSTNASSYMVYRNTENNSATAGIIISNIVGLGTNDYAGTPLRRYYYWVKATNVFGFGLSGFSDSALGWSLLASPQSVSASAGAFTNLIRVSWIAGSTDPTAHVIFRSESSDSSTATRQAEVLYNYTTDTNYDDTAITRGVSYYYWVAAKNDYGTSSWKQASGLGGTVPITPLDLSASDGTDSNMVQVTWNPSPGATSYNVYRYITFDSSYAAQIGFSSTNYYDDTSASAGVLYYYWVRAVNNAGISEQSTFNSGWRGLAPPGNVAAGNGSSISEVTVSWSAASAASYEIWRGTSDNVGSASKLVNSVSGVSYSDCSAIPGTVYYYWVKSKRGNYSSAFSLSALGYRAIGMIDIGVSDFVFVPTVFGPLAHPSAVSFKVSNLSAFDMVDPNITVQYDLYLSENAVYGVGADYWIGGSIATVPLNAGASARVVSPANVRSSITVPDWATGNYYVFVFVNHCLPSAWLDPNLANNVAGRLGNSISIAAATALQPVWNDFDGDGKSDFAVYNPSAGSASSPQAGSLLCQGFGGQAGQAGSWKVWLSASGYAPVALTLFGGAGYRAVPRDYDCDGKFDPAVYQEAPSASSGQAGGGWQVQLSGSGYALAQALLQPSGQPVPGDYDGDGLVDPAVYQQAGTWRAWLSGSGYQMVSVTGMGGDGQYPVPADYDGDAKTDPAVYQESVGMWRVWLSGSGYQEVNVINLGGSGWRPVPADYDADGRVDPAVYQEATGAWRVWPSSNGYQETGVTGCGGTGQKAVPGDYDGDGRVDLAVYWESMGIWRLWLSSYGYSEMDFLFSGGEGFHAITFGE